MEKFKVETISIHPERPYLKVYLNVDTDFEMVASSLEKLRSVNHANVTYNQARTRKSIVVYPMETYRIDEVDSEVRRYLSEKLVK